MATTTGGFPPPPSYRDMLHRKPEDLCANLMNSWLQIAQPHPNVEGSNALEGSIRNDKAALDPPPSQPKVIHAWEPGKCIPQVPNRSLLEVTSECTENNMQYMRDHTLVGALLGIWPTERDPLNWIVHWWKP